MLFSSEEAYGPHVEWVVCFSINLRRSIAGSNMSVSVRGYEMKPDVYSFSATVITTCDERPRKREPCFCSSTVVRGRGFLGGSQFRPATIRVFRVITIYESWKHTISWSPFYQQLLP